MNSQPFLDAVDALNERARTCANVVNRLFWPASLVERNPLRYYAPHSWAWVANISQTRPPRRRGPAQQGHPKRLTFRHAWNGRRYRDKVNDLPF